MSFPTRFGMPQQFYHAGAVSMSMVPVLPANSYTVVPAYPTVISGGARALPTRKDLFPPSQSEKPPQTTCFVGNIHERCSNDLIRAMLQECGNVVTWKRIQGSNGKYQAFGFCEFDHPESTLRALRILHQWKLADKRLVVKVDDKTRLLLRNFVDKKRQAMGKSPQKSDKDEASVNFDGTENDDEKYKKAIETLIRQEAADLLTVEDGEITSRSPTLHGKGGNLDIDNMDREKKEYIRDEITRFRESHREDERTSLTDKAKEQRDRRDRSATFRDQRPASAASSSPGRPASTLRSGSRVRRSRSRSPERQRRARPDSVGSDSSPDRDRSSSPASVSTSSSKRRRRNNRSRSRERRYSEDEEETKERKKLERRLRLKEQQYKERLSKWERRERKMAKEHERITGEKRRVKKEEQREAKKLKEFLEDYDDERDDPKYYKSSSFFQRKREYEKERELDARDRNKEKEEIDDLRKQILHEGFSGNADSEAVRRHEVQEDALLRKLRAQSDSPSPHRRLGSKPDKTDENPEGGEEAVSSDTDSDRESNGSKGKGEIKTEAANEPAPAMVAALTEKGQNGEKSKPLGFGSMKVGGNWTQISSVFGEDVDTEHNEYGELTRKVKRPFVPLELTEEEKIEAMTPEEKKRLIKSLIEKIPTGKEELFAYPIDWGHVDESLIERRVKPWVNKKILEYIGEEEPSLVDFICQKVNSKTTATNLLEDITMVLDDEAEVFVVKMWRLLIYESEAKKLGLVKSD